METYYIAYAILFFVFSDLIIQFRNKKSLILFDEINSSLDFHTRLNFIKIIDKYFNDSTIIIVTHENENFIYDEIINIQKI